MTEQFLKNSILCIVSILIFSAVALSQEIKITERDGMKIIHNPSTPIPEFDGPRNLVLIPDIAIGETSEQSDYIFGSLVSMAVDDSGNIFALDNKDVCVKVFGKDGRFLYSFGSKGQGPGEFISPKNLFLVDDENILVVDFSRRRISYFKKSGEFTQSILLKKHMVTKVLPASAKLIYAEIMSLPNWDLIIIDSSMDKLGTIDSFPIKNQNNPPPIQLWQRFLFALSSKNRLVWAQNYEYSIHVAGRDNRTAIKIIKDHTPVKVSMDYVKGEVKKKYPGRTLPDGIKIPGHWPKNLPAIDSLVCSDTDYIFIRTNERDGSGNIFYDVFDKSGRYIHKFAHPEREMITVIKDDMLYCLIQADGSGVPQIKRYRMKWE